MSPENKKNSPDFKNIFHGLFFISTLVLFSKFSFTNEEKLEILKRAKGKCESCGDRTRSKDLIAGHIRHFRDEQYHDIKNGKAHCKICELGHHLINHKNSSRSIGVDPIDNRAAIISWYSSLSVREKKKAQRRYGNQLLQILPARYKRM